MASSWLALRTSHVPHSPAGAAPESNKLHEEFPLPSQQAKHSVCEVRMQVHSCLRTQSQLKGLLFPGISLLLCAMGLRLLFINHIILKVVHFTNKAYNNK